MTRHAFRSGLASVAASLSCCLLAACGTAAPANTPSSSSTSGTAGAGSSGTGASGAVRCSTAPAPPGTQGNLKLPDKSTAAGKTFVATVTTNCGDLTLELDGAKAPQTVASFVQLAQQYWVDAPCQRLTTQGIFVVQCGDPTGTGSGSPGYGFGIENAPAGGDYPTGTLAMARTTDPNSNGGQFFIVYQDTQLPTDGGGYSIFGKVTGGLPILQYVASRGVDGGGADGAPAQPLSILKITVHEKKA